MLRGPGRSVALQLRHLPRAFGLQPGAKQVGEQVVVAPPAAHLIQRHQEKACRLDLLQQRLAAGAAGDRIAQFSRKPPQHRGLQQEGADRLGLLFEHLLGQEVQHVAVAAGERGHEPGHVALPAQRQASELEAGGPAFGAAGQRGHGRIRQAAFGARPYLGQQSRRLTRREPQIGGAQLGQLPAGPQPGQRQRRVGAAGQHQVQPGRAVLQQELDRSVHGRGLDDVVVVENQHRVGTGIGGQLVDERGHQRLEGSGCGRAEQRAQPSIEARAYPVHRGHHMTPEPGRVVVPGVQRQPGRPGRDGAGPSRPAAPSCRSRRARRPAPAHAPGCHRAGPSAAGAVHVQAAIRAGAAWWPAGHRVPLPPWPGLPRRTQPSLTRTLCASRLPAGRTRRPCWSPRLRQHGDQP